MLIFTNYTNQWKGRAEETKKHMSHGPLLSLTEIKKQKDILKFNHTSRSIPGARQYKPTLPMPKTLATKQRRISFIRDIDDVRQVAEYLFEDRDTDAFKVGEECFNVIFKDSK